MDVSREIKAEPMESSELAQFTECDKKICIEKIKSENDDSACSEQNYEGLLPLAVYIKTEDCKLEENACLTFDINSDGPRSIEIFDSGSHINDISEIISKEEIHELLQPDLKPYVRKKKNLPETKSTKEAKKRKLSTDQIFKCPECDFQSHFQRGVSAHYRFLHMPREKINCTYCSESLNNRKEIKLHMWTKHRREIPDVAEKFGLTLYTCDICKYETINRKMLEAHKTTHGRFEDTKIYKCTECNYESTRKSHFGRHFKQMHSADKEVHICNFCNKNIFDKYNLADHLLNLHNDKIEKGIEKIFTYTIMHCTVCDFRTMKTWKLNKHMVKHGDLSKVKTLKCYNCEYETLRKENLITHMTLHSSIRYKCEYCDERFSKQAHLNSHLLRSHEEYRESIGREVFSCDSCNYKTIWKHHLKNHIKLHREESSNTNGYTCEMCGFKTTLKQYLESHVKSQHERNTKTCPLCSKSCQSHGVLGNHILHKHQTEQGRTLLKTLNYKVYSCKICPAYQSVLLSKFKVHMYKTHNDESYASECMKAALSCSQCEYKASRKYTLKIHMLRKHNGDVLPEKR